MSLPAWVEAARAELPAARTCHYLNSGTAGPLPRCASDALLRAATAEFETGRANFTTWGPFFATLDRTRARLARLVGARPDEIALTHHTTEGVNVVLNGLDWRAGDRVVTTSLEHDSVVIPLGLLAERHGVVVTHVDIGLGERALAGLGEALQGGARLVVLSHVAYSSGAWLPLAECAALAHAAGALVLVDGAQAAGAMPVDVHALDVDFYTVSGQKWPLGPEGTGALYVRAGCLTPLRVAASGYFSVADHDFHGHCTLWPDARRFETGMMYRPGLAALEASLGWLLDEVGLERAFARSLELAAEARTALTALGGVAVVTPAPCASQLLTFDLPDFAPAELHGLAGALAASGVVVRSIDHPPYGLRASFGFFNTAEDIAALRQGVAAALARGPAAVPLNARAARLPRTR